MLKVRRVKAACVMDLDLNPKLVPEAGLSFLKFIRWLYVAPDLLWGRLP